VNLLLPAGELGRAVVGPCRQSDALEQLGRSPNGGGIDARVCTVRRHGYIFEGGKVLEQMVKLKDKAEVAIANLTERAL
jgi:hypothetical protein